VGDIRGVGAMIGVEFVKDRHTKEPNEEYLGAFVRETMSRGAITVSCGMYHNVLRYLVPLVITDAELEEGLDVMAESARRVRGASGQVPSSRGGE
jgi:4-aminobutyrate aminotransferase / (S)-3-amino-2-methylpropionate transaminase / 5-aminovalerate transaminase